MANHETLPVTNSQLMYELLEMCFEVNEIAEQRASSVLQLGNDRTTTIYRSGSGIYDISLRHEGRIYDAKLATKTAGGTPTCWNAVVTDAISRQQKGVPMDKRDALVGYMLRILA